MALILDNNVLFSIMNPRSAASYLFSSLRVEFFAPDFVKLEIDKYRDECMSKSKLSQHEFKMRLLEVKESVKFFNSSEYESFLPKAKESLPEDPKDLPYIALALSANAAIWSNDPHLKKQKLVEVFTTKELIDELLKGEF